MNKKSLAFLIYSCLMALITFACGVGLELEQGSIKWLFLTGLVTMTTLASLVLNDCVNRLEQSYDKEDTNSDIELNSRKGNK